MQVEGQHELQYLVATGARVRNTYATFLQLGNSSPKGELIPHNIREWHHFPIKEFRLKMGMRNIS